MNEPSTSRHSRIAFVLLPWFPVGVAFAAVWSLLRPSAPVLISTQMMIGGSPPVYTSAWEQAEQAYPHIHLFAAYLFFSGVAFVVGLILLAAGALRHRRFSHGTPTI